MGQNEIFKLLLIILLLVSGDNDGENCRTPTGNLNSIIIAALLLGYNCSGNGDDMSGTTF